MPNTYLSLQEKSLWKYTVWYHFFLQDLSWYSNTWLIFVSCYLKWLVDRLRFLYIFLHDIWGMILLWIESVKLKKIATFATLLKKKISMIVLFLRYSSTKQNLKEYTTSLFLTILLIRPKSRDIFHCIRSYDLGKKKKSNVILFF